MVLTFALNHHLTGKCIGDLLKLLSLHCIAPNNCLTSLYHFKKFFANEDEPLRRHYFCNFCQLPQEVEGVCGECHENSGRSYFITVPIIPQLRTMLKRTGFYEKLSHRFDRVKVHADNLEDIYDGEIYKEFNVNGGGFLANQNAISFCWNSDGVPMFKSSKYSIWPFFLRINELPYADRNRKENVLLAGLWFGCTKPLPNLFLQPLLHDMDILRDGIQCQVPHLEHPILIRGMVLCGTCDMPAKALFLNFMSYNGYYGCTACKQRGERLADNRHVYRYTNHITLRTDEETQYFARVAFHQQEPVFGVKGVSILSHLVSRPVTSTSIDPMHKYSGIVKKLLDIWFSESYEQHPATLRHFLPLIDKRFVQLNHLGMYSGFLAL
jgi:hypothetical protein